MAKLRFLVAAAAIAVVASSACGASDPQRVGQYDFGYQISGDFRARPVQVFDDGVSKTYFQFRVGEPIPAVMLGEGQKIVFPRPEGPYYVVDGIARDYLLAMGMSRGRAVHASVIAGVFRPADLAALQPPRSDQTHGMVASDEHVVHDGVVQRAAYAQPSPESRNVWTSNSYAQPLRGDVVHWQAEQPREASVGFARGVARLTRQNAKAIAALARSVGTTTRVEVIGTDDDSMREQLPVQRAEAIKGALVGAGVPTHNVAIIQAREAGTVHGTGRQRTVDSIVRWYPVTAMAAAPAPTLQRADALERGPSPETARMPASGGLAEPDQTAKPVAVAPRAIAPAAPAAPEGVEWELHRADVSMSGAMLRWGKVAGYEVVWDTPVDAPITGDARVASGDFRSAVTQVVHGLQKAGYPIKARMYSDKVVRFYGAE
jgi:hypothetical protein